MKYDEMMSQIEKEYEKTINEFLARIAEVEQQRELTPYERALKVYIETSQRKDAILEESRRALKELKRQSRLWVATERRKAYEKKCK